MSPKDYDLEGLAENFLEAFYKGRFSGDRSFPVGKISIGEAYQIQDKIAAMRIDKGEKVVGYKVGCTSKAIQEQFGLNEPINARLFEPYIYDDGAELLWQDYINCAIEPEMVFVIGKDLEGDALSDEELKAGIEEVRAGIEIHQFKYWFSPNSLQELICSGGIHAGLVIGKEAVSPRKLSFGTETFKVFKEEKLITSGPAREIMGGPLHSLRWLVGNLTRKGQFLKAGSYVIPGSPVELISIDKETLLKVEIDKVGSVRAYFK